MANSFRPAVAVMVHDDHLYLSQSLRSFESVQDRFVFVSRQPWNGEPGDWEASAAVANECRCTVVEGEWLSEAEHRRTVMTHLGDLGFSHILIPDSDEIIEPELLANLLQIAEADLADRVYVEWDTYWKDPYHVVRPREGFTPCMMLKLGAVRHAHLRHYEGGRGLLLNEAYGIVHHLSYAGGDERIARKISSWSHRDELVSGWWERSWKGWEKDKRLGHLHPTHPQAYLFVEHIDLPPALKDAGFEPEVSQPAPVPDSWPTVSVVIPLHGGEEDIKACLTSLSSCFSLLHDVIVVDNGSPDDAAKTAKDLLRLLPGGRLIEIGENRGFAHACNRGAAESAGEIIVFLNSDTVVPRSGLICLIQSLIRSGTIGAAGPYTNHAGHHQPTHTTYTSIDSMEHFANDFAEGPGEDRDVDMLVGFCLAVRRSAWHEVGSFDEGFGLGLFEDNDLCYRLRRESYRLVLSGQSFVHHHGSKTLTRVTPNPEQLLYVNQARFVSKWKMDMEAGFSNGLSGLSADPLYFDHSKKPERLLARVAEQAVQADISLCMIVRNEERVLGDCLRSAKPFFKEIIVVDTGSTDTTREIAKGFGAKLIEFPWTESFSEARNVSLSHASGKWICWLDADDTLPLASGQSILEGVINAQADVAGFVVPVRFTDGGPHGGVQVDHVKLFRNLPGVQFEGRIHEQILRSLNQAAGPQAKIVRLDAVVLHSGYDTSEEGQARKRERDARLLELDLAERPNHPFVLFNLGMTSHYTDDHNGAVEWLQKCLEHSEDAESHVKKAHVMLGVSLLNLGRKLDAIETWNKGLKLASDPELHFHLAKTAAEDKQLDVAREHYLAALSSDVSGQYNSIDRGVMGFKTMHNLAMVEADRGDYDAARHWYLKAMEQAPEFRPSAFALFDLARQRGDLDTAKSVLSFIEASEGKSESWHKMREALFA